MDNIVFAFTFSGLALVIGAVLVASIVGVLCRLGAKTPSSLGFGMVAAALTIVLICLGRVVLNAPSTLPDQVAVEISDEAMILTLAESIAWQAKMGGTEIAWPEGATLETASQKEDYPPQIWQTAAQQWSYYTPQQKEAARQKASGIAVTALKASATNSSILGRIGIWGGCWSILAGALALVIGGRFVE